MGSLPGLGGRRFGGRMGWHARAFQAVPRRRGGPVGLQLVPRPVPFVPWPHDPLWEFDSVRGSVLSGLAERETKGHITV